MAEGVGSVIAVVALGVFRFVGEGEAATAIFWLGRQLCSSCERGKGEPGGSGF